MTEFPKPEKIYKYVSLATAIRILDTSSLKFAKPSTFNDPFDCDVNLLDFNFDGEVTPMVLNEIETLRVMYSGKLDAKSKDFWEKGYKAAQLGKVNSSRICCFSLINDNILMWSHYADNHAGVCLEFDNLMENKFVNLLDKNDISEGIVGYTAKTRINYVAEERMFAFYKLFFCKSEMWEYEKEFRMVLLDNKEEFHQFKKESLLGIYFGINTNAEDRNTLIKAGNQNNFRSINYYIGEKGRLSIKFTPLVDVT